MKTDFARIAWALSLAATGIGCASEREQREQEQAYLRGESQRMQEILDTHPVGSRWAMHPDTMKLLDHKQRLDQRLQEIQ